MKFDKTTLLDLPKVNDKRPAPRKKPQFKPRNHHPASRFIPPDHAGRVVVCFATGPSLSQEVVEIVQHYHAAGRVVAAGLGDSYRIVPYLDELYACDRGWWRVHTENCYVTHGGRPVNVFEYPARLWGNQTAWDRLRTQEHVNIVQGIGGTGFSPDRSFIHWGNNSGFQLLNLVHHMRARTMLLVGYNMSIPKGSPVHFFGNHGPGLTQPRDYSGFVRQFRKIAQEHREKIINCTPTSALDCFRVQDLEHALRTRT